VETEGDVVPDVEEREQGVGLEDGVDRSPVLGCSNPAIMRRVVVLPQPDGPSSEKNSPASMSRSIPRTAGTSP
jgi:hypothetical protein